MALPVDRAQSHAMNLQVLKRQDEAVMDIVDMASHVVVYEFDQAQQSWKRKDVEGCLFVVKRYSSPRFQIFVNNRLSTTNMTIPVNSSLEVDSVDTFLILRSPDASAVGGFAIYGLWFFPEEDREKILKLLQRMVQTVKEPTTTQPAPQKTVEPQPQQEEPQTQPAEQQQQQNKQPRQSRQRQKEGGQRGGRGRNKRENSGGDNSKPATPTAILQRPAKSADDSTASAPTSATSVATQEAAAPPHSAPPGMASTAGYTPISREEGIAAGNAILGMLGGMSVSSTSAGPVLAPPAYVKAATTAAPAPQPRSRTSSAQNGPASTQAAVSKEQLKQTLIALLDEPQFFDQIYHAYVSRVHSRS